MGHLAHGSAALIAVSLLAACTATTATRQTVKPAAAPDVSVAVTPRDRTGDVPTDETVIVAADAGTLKSVHVTSDHGRLPGVISDDGTRWRSNQTARPGTTYTVRTVAVNAEGKRKESTSTFTTVKAKDTFDIEYITPNSNDTGLTVGIGMPIMITFDKPVTDRVSVERNLTVQSSKPVEGAWHWFDDRHVDYRPTEYWPARTKVRVEARLAGVRGGEGLYGKRDVRLDFRIGRAQITRGTTQNHVLTVKRDGKVIRTMPMSAGQGGAWKFYTTSGIHLAMSRENVTVMTSPGIGPGEPGYYQLTVYDTVRISNSGEYVHSAPWSVGAQGNSNVSHGCVNVSPENAKWFLDNTLIGDPIIITGSPRVLEPTNGWGHWQENWKEWLKWSSLKDGPTTTF
ncbi:Ig-like domain-containing protein [Nonomuraea roseoviolacea subsp. roseoviolacea]|uniref:Lipoprotein-anchoring transpeptidase ErfK/SrfK n=1 Tax=Nonomuraea roseoviolacea subsp. carminata TaxID=160689 RepID=A0ABT1JRT4_9ACTN|nr:Ig-like domain-containing protein [Nonomuraea roseoviolacea]MCP2344458.1 lipoprotein-anchoring transpeptidase ErfK/SrfK [Nonomuraea roseoviolacea subsp. carminata]